MFDALVLAGGSARRLGGLDKPGLQVGGTAMLDRVLRSTAAASRTVVVGPVRQTCRPVSWTREDPPGGGPVAALAAGLPLLTASVVALLAADLPFLDVPAVAELTEALPDQAAGRVVVEGGRPQWLCSAWRTADLRAALTGVPVGGARLRDLLAPLATISLVADRLPSPWADVDTADDLLRARSSA